MTTVATYATRNGKNLDDTFYYDYPGGKVIEERIGGSLAWINYNPGNILYASSGPGSANALGAIGEYSSSNGFTYDIFPSYAVGFDAIITLLESSEYEGAGDTIDTAIATWSGDTGTLLASYEATITAAVGLPGSTPLSALSSTQFGDMASGIKTQEGYNSGTDITTSTPSQAPDLVIDSLTVSPSATIGGGVEISTTVGNNSTVGAGAFDIQVYFSTDPHLDSNAKLLADIPVISLAGNTSYSWGESALLPSWINTPGQYYVIVYANQNQGVSESNYNNDSFSTAFEVSTAATAPVVVNDTQLAIKAGTTTPITSNLLSISALGNAANQLTYTVVSAPSYGTLFKAGVATSSFTQADIDNGAVSYTETASGVTSDNFTFYASDLAGAQTAVTTFQFGVSGTDTTTPTLVNNNNLTTTVGATAAITSNLLRVTDTDNDTDAQLTYTVVSAPSYGTLFKAGVATTSFTQADIDNGLISYREIGTNTSSDFFTAIVTNAAGNRAPDAVLFNIQINAAGSTIGDGQTTNITSGQTDNGLNVQIGGTLNVLSGGTANYTVNNGGLDFVYSGGNDNGATINGQGRQYLSGGHASGTTVNSGSFEIINSGGVATATNLNGNSFLTVQSGGTASGTVDNGGGESVNSGGTVVGDIVNSGGYNIIGFGGSASDETINGGTLEIDYGAVIGGGISFEGQGGDLNINTLTMPSAVISGFAPGNLIDLSEVYFSNGDSVQLLPGNTLQVVEDGTTYSLQLDPSQDFSAKQFHVSTDGYGTEITLADIVGGSQVYTVGAGQTNKDLLVSEGGVVNVLSGGTVIGESLSGTEINYGSAVGATINSGGSENIESGGTAAGTVVNDGGHQYVQSGGTATGTLLNDPGIQVVQTGGAASSTTVSGGEQDLYGTATGTLVSNGGALVVESGGTATSSFVSSGGTETILSGGTDDGATVGSGGRENVFGGASDTTIENGATVVAYDSSLLSGTIVDNGTLIFELTGGESFAGALTGSGSLVVDGSGALALSGGNSFTGTDTISGGTLDLTAASAGGNGSILLGSGGGGEGDPTLQIDGTIMPANTIVGFSDFTSSGDTIDLTSVAYDDAGSADLNAGNNQLVITEDNQTYDLQLDPTKNFSGEFFYLSADASGTGTNVIEESVETTAPIITGTVAGQTTTSEAPVTPFSSVTITDANDGGTDTDTLSIAFSGGGVLSGTGLSGSAGNYGLSGTAAAITSELDALSFTPVNGVPNASVTTTFTLIDKSSATPNALVAFNGTDGANPYASLISDAAGDVFGTTLGEVTGGSGTVFEIANTGTVSAPIYSTTTLVSFNGTNGANPYASLISDAAGDLFGTTFSGGADGCGTVFELTNSGTVSAPIYSNTPTTLVSFNNTDGEAPAASLISDAAGDLFGTTQDGGTDGYGTVFEIVKTASGYASVPTILVSFNRGDGFGPEASLISDAAGDLFGTTDDGGTDGYGTVFEIANTGTVSAPIYSSTPTTLVSFNNTDGTHPLASLISDAAGDLFGTTLGGGTDGTVFELTNSGSVRAPIYSGTPMTLVSFTDGADGAGPAASLISDAAGDLFGTTTSGGTGGHGTVFELVKTGSVYTFGAAAVDTTTSVIDHDPAVAPTVTNTGGTTTWTEASGTGPSTAMAIDSGLTVADVDNTTLASATVSITGGFQFGQDVLAFINNNSTMGNISGSYNSGTGVMTLTSTGASATLAQWQAALDSVTYNDSARSVVGLSRTISFTINDGMLSSATAFKTVSVATPIIVTVTTTNGIDLRWPTLYNELANSPVGSGGSATQYTCVDSGQFNGQSASIQFVVTGTGFTYGGSLPNIQLIGGTITGVQEQDTSSNVLATFTGLSISATTFQAALNSYTSGGSANATALNAIFLALDYYIEGGAGPDLLQGGNLDDTIIGSTGNDTIDGGAGTNTVDYSGLTTPGLFAIIQGGAGTVNMGGANGVDTLTNVQNLVDTGTGRTNGDVFEVDSAENITASSSNFNYLIELSAGVNLAYGTNFTGITEFVSNVGTNTVDLSADPNFAYLFGSTGNDTLTLGSGGGYMFGEGGTNVLTGGANATNLFVGGDSGSDTMNGGTGTASNYYFVDGNDQVNGAGAFNTMIELVSGVTVQLDSAQSHGSAQYQDVQEFVAYGGTNAITVAGSDADLTYLYGGAGNDTLTTGSGGGYLFGGGGINVLTGGGGVNNFGSLDVFVADGGSGFDTMNGGAGSNIYYIDNNSTVNGAGTFNTVIELQQNATLTLGSAQLGNDVQQVILNGGTNTADFSIATFSVYLYGGAGNDTLIGGRGNDYLYGGAGTNTFQFDAVLGMNKTGWGQDTIMDWTAGTNNQIDLTSLAVADDVHAITDLTQTIVNGSDVITSSHTGTNSITLLGVGSTLTASSFHFA